MKKQLKYAGIGSRQTPPEVIASMVDGAEKLAVNWLLRSGHAPGADQAFERGALNQRGKAEIFIPWDGFQGAHVRNGYIVPEWTDEIIAIARRAHPRWDFLSTAVKKLHARNVCQILGKDLNDPVDCVICWTPYGSGSGGTGQAIRIATQRNIPVFDIALESNVKACIQFLQKAENGNR